MTVRSKTMPYAIGLAAALALSGCSGGAPAPAQTTPVTGSTTPTVTHSGPPSTTAQPTTTSATAAQPSFPPGLPDAAKKHDQTGAEAFVKYFITELNGAWTRAEPNRIAILCDLDTSKACAAFVKTATDLKNKRQHYVQMPVSIQSIISFARTEDGLMRVHFRGFQERSEVIDANGRVVLTDQREASQFMFYLAWTNSGWQIHEVERAS